MTKNTHAFSRNLAQTTHARETRSFLIITVMSFGRILRNARLVRISHVSTRLRPVSSTSARCEGEADYNEVYGENRTYIGEREGGVNQRRFDRVHSRRRGEGDSMDLCISGNKECMNRERLNCRSCNVHATRTTDDERSLRGARVQIIVLTI